MSEKIEQALRVIEAELARIAEGSPTPPDVYLAVDWHDVTAYGDASPVYLPKAELRIRKEIRV